MNLLLVQKFFLRETDVVVSAFQMIDMFFFLFLLSIWVVAYGVAKQGILIDNDDRLDWIVRGAVYEPYLIIFGNFPTNIDCEWKNYKVLFLAGTLSLVLF